MIVKCVHYEKEKEQKVFIVYDVLLLLFIFRLGFTAKFTIKEITV